MVTFSFNSIAKKNYSRTIAPRTTVIIDKKVMAVIWIEIDGKFTANTKHGDICTIDEKSYSCKGLENIYRVASNERNGLRYIRSGKLLDTDHRFWLPFHAGTMVEGKVTENVITKEKTFTILKIYNDMKTEQSATASRFYFENKEEIDKILISKQNGNN